MPRKPKQALAPKYPDQDLKSPYHLNHENKLDEQATELIKQALLQKSETTRLATMTVNNKDFIFQPKVKK